MNREKKEESPPDKGFRSLDKGQEQSPPDKRQRSNRGGLKAPDTGKEQSPSDTGKEQIPLDKGLILKASLIRGAKIKQEGFSRTIN